jgi:hypothetical protein
MTTAKPTNSPDSVWRVTIALISLALLLIITAYAYTRPLEDFVAYWTAGHLLLAHKNPYSLAEVFQSQRLLGWTEPIPLVALNPPWALPLFAPLGLFNSYALAWLTWVLVLTILIAWSSRLLMNLFFQDLLITEISDTPFHRILFAFTFYPVLLALKFAQTSSLVLLGISAFLFFESKQRPYLAGAFLCLAAMKPNLIYLVWLALLSWSVKYRRWKILVSATAAITLFTGIALLLDPKALAEYREVGAGPLKYLLLPGVAGAVRTLFGGHSTFWLQFAPPVLGMTWFAMYWRKHRKNWVWVERMPALVTASLLTTAWGYLFDQSLLAIPIIALAAGQGKKFGRLPTKLVVIYTALNVVLILAGMASSPWGYLPAPVLLSALLWRESRAQTLQWRTPTGQAVGVP